MTKWPSQCPFCDTKLTAIERNLNAPTRYKPCGCESFDVDGRPRDPFSAVRRVVERFYAGVATRGA